jgi:sugar O-acyltransferase (sialic acid O-acetyltransferase NeuD family)
LILAIEEKAPGTWDFKGFVADDIPSEILMERLGAAYLGNIESFIDSIEDFSGFSFVVAIGNGQTRKMIEPKLQNAGLTHACLVHPTASIGVDVSFGPGTIICANSVLTTSIRLGNSVHVHIGSKISHDVTIGNHVTLSPGVNVTGNVIIDDDVTVYSSSTVLPGILIGRKSVIGAGSVVTKNVPNDVTVVGIPAREYVAKFD